MLLIFVLIVKTNLLTIRWVSSITQHKYDAFYLTIDIAPYLYTSNLSLKIYAILAISLTYENLL